MAVSLPSCGAQAAIVFSASTCARVRGGGRIGDLSSVECFHGWRELALQVVECAGRTHALSRFGSGGERRSRKDRFARCAVVRLCSLVFSADVRGALLLSQAFSTSIWEDAPLKDAYYVSNVARLFNPGDFDASKLTVRFEGHASNIKLKSVEDLLPRKYTLTHSDVTGELLLSIGHSFNRQQLSDWYTRLMRDEIVAEWRGSEQISLHVHCHVSGGHVLLAPAALRNSIFEREMPLVLEAIRHGDEDLLAEYPELHASTVWVHFHSSDPAYNRADCWGPLFYAASPIRRVTGKLVPSCISEPFTPLTLVKVQKDPAELCSVMSP